MILERVRISPKGKAIIHRARGVPDANIMPHLSHPGPLQPVPLRPGPGPHLHRRRVAGGAGLRLLTALARPAIPKWGLSSCYSDFDCEVRSRAAGISFPKNGGTFYRVT